jgi:hypothetical protein
MENPMKRIFALFLLVVSVLPLATTAEAARSRVVRRGHRATVVVRPGFPLHRRLPLAYIRAPRVAVRVAPRVYLPHVAFAAVAVSAPVASARAWRDSEDLDREDGWTEFTLNVDRRGSGLLLGIDKGAAQISFAEVVFENGDTQVVDFSDKVRATGTYSLLDFKDGRKVDHVRIVAKADTRTTEIALHLVA